MLNGLRLIALCEHRQSTSLQSLSFTHSHTNGWLLLLLLPVSIRSNLGVSASPKDTTMNQDRAEFEPPTLVDHWTTHCTSCASFYPCKGCTLIPGASSPWLGHFECANHEWSPLFWLLLGFFWVLPFIPFGSVADWNPKMSKSVQQYKSKNSNKILQH